MGRWLLAFGSLVVACAPPELPVSTHRYVVSVLEVSTVAGDPPAAFGHDLDGVDSDGTGPHCVDEEDFVSVVTGEPGVDNQLAARLVPLLDSVLPAGGYDGQLRDRIAAGDLVVVLEVTSRGLADDPEATAHVTLGDADLGTVAAPITGGRIDLTLAVFPLAVAIDATTVELHVRGARLTGTLVPDGSAIIDGELGGSVGIADAAPLVEPLWCGICEEQSLSSLTGADLAPSADPTSCEAFSAGLHFEAVAAR